MSLTLYKAATDLTAMLDSGIDEDGVISPELEQALATFEGKGAAVAAYALNNEAAAEMCQKAAKAMMQRAISYTVKAKRMREYLADQMRKTGTTSIEADDKSFGVKLYIDRDSSVEIFQHELVPELYMRQPETPPPVPDKKLIAKALKDGADVPGAVIRKKDRLEIR